MVETPELKARNAIAGALKCSVEAVESGASVETLPQWDSIGHINIILALETDLGRTLRPEEIAGISSVADVARLYAQDSA